MEERTGREGRRWRKLRELLGFEGMGCCGSLWGTSRPPNRMTLAEDEYQEAPYQEDDEEEEEEHEVVNPRDNDPDLQCLLLDQNPAAAATEEMNLATALAVERQFRATASTGAETPVRVSLMRLLEDNAGNRNGEGEGEGEGEGVGWCCCCVCMGRRKGAAFIPCGHTFCRVCARQLWLNRGFCPLCNRSILEILDIF